jgi:hypothetical protein
LSYLRLFRAAAACNDALDQSGRVFGNCETRARAYEQRNAARMSQLGGSLRVARIKERLDAGHEGRVNPDDIFQRALDRYEAKSDGSVFVGVDGAMSMMDEARSAALDDAPPEVSCPWVDAEDDHEAWMRESSSSEISKSA